MNGKIMMNGKAYTSSGTPVKEVTLSEYLALPDWKRTNGVMYMIKDVANEGVGFPPLIYSDDEREVGVWKDGKPLYQKSFSFAPSYANDGFDVSGLHIDEVVYIWGTVKATNSNTTPIYYYTASSDGCVTYYSGSDAKIKVWYSGTHLASGYKITIQYTKTTDAAGQGKWTTDGVYAHHYSTSEKVVGTWIDEKPLYEKTFHNTFSNVSVDTSQTVADLTSLSIDKMIKMEGFTYLTRSSGNITIFLDNGEYIQFDYVPNNGCLLRFQQKYAGSSNCDVYCTIQYTKTTD